MVHPRSDDDARKVISERSLARAATAPASWAESADEAEAPARQRRILFVSPQPFYEDRGSPIAIRRVLEALSELGEAVDLLTLPVGQAVDLPGLRIFRVGARLPVRHVPVGFSLRKVLLNCLLAAAIPRRLRQEDCDCIHAVEEAAFAATLAAKLFRIPVVYDMHSSLPEQLAKHRLLCSAAIQKGLRACERWLFRHADLIVCSAGLRSYVRSIDPSVPVHEWLFPSAPAENSPRRAAQLRERHAIPKDAPVVLYSGTFESYQGLTLLIEAAAEVHTRLPEVIFVLVGASATSDLGAHQAPWLRVVGRQPQGEIAPYLAMADVLVSPRVHGRNLPLKVFDYMAAGKPIVATDCEPHRVVLDESTARLVELAPDALADGIVELLTQRELADRLSRAARAYADTHCTPENFTASVARIYGGVRMRAADEVSCAAGTGAVARRTSDGRRSPRRARRRSAGDGA